MRRDALLYLAGPVLLALGACSESTTPSTTPAAIQGERRQRELTFWRLYREATRLRVAGDVARAMTQYDSALALKPQHGDALYHSGNAAFELGNFDIAESRWRHLLAVDGSNARAHVQLGAMYSCARPGAPQDLDLARRELQQALALNRAETGPQLRLGEIALLQGDEQTASRHLAAVRQTNERSVAAHYLGGYLHWRGGRVEQAQVALEQAAALAGGDLGEVSASAEGQTKRGHRPLLESSAEGPLAPFWNNVHEQVRPLSEAAVTEQYERFHKALAAQRAAMARRRETTEEDG